MSVSGFFICSLIVSFVIPLSIGFNLEKLCFILLYMNILIGIFSFEPACYPFHQCKPIVEASDAVFLFIHMLFVCFSWLSSVLGSVFFFLLFFLCARSRVWIDWISARGKGFGFALEESAGRYVCSNCLLFIPLISIHSQTSYP